MPPIVVKKSELYKNIMHAGAGQSMYLNCHCYYLFHVAAIFDVDFDKLPTLQNVYWLTTVQFYNY